MATRAKDGGRIDHGNGSPGPTGAAALPGWSGGVYDGHYKRLFAFPRMVEDLLRGFVRGEWVEELGLHDVAEALGGVRGRGGAPASR